MTNGQQKLSVVDVGQVRGVDAAHEVRRPGRVTPAHLRAIATALALVVAYES